MIRRKKGIRRRVADLLRRQPNIRYVALISAFILICAALVFLIEHKSNNQYGNFLDSVYWAVVTTATIGYGDIAPKTPAGRAVTIVIILFGAAIMGTFIGRISSLILEHQMKEEQGLLDYSSQRGHFVICGWKREMDLVLRDVLERNPEIAPDQIIMLHRAPAEEVKPILNDIDLKGVRYVNGDYIEERDLIRAGIRGAARVLVVADYFTEGDLQHIDSKTVMAVMSIKNLNKGAYVCAELLDTKFEKYLRLSHCDEVLLSRDLSRMMLSSASLGTGLTHVVQTLLSKTSSAGIATIDIPPSFIGKPYGELAAHFVKNDASQLVGILENTGNITDRKREALREAQKNPDISTLLPDLKQAKSLTANDPIINPPADYAIKRHSRGIVIQGSTYRAEAA